MRVDPEDAVTVVEVTSYDADANRRDRGEEPKAHAGSWDAERPARRVPGGPFGVCRGEGQWAMTGTASSAAAPSVWCSGLPALTRVKAVMPARTRMPKAHQMATE